MQPIAELRLSGVRHDGQVVLIAAAVGQPYQGKGRWCCPVSLTGIDDRSVDVGGEDSMQALCLGLRLVGLRLADFVTKGGRLFNEGEPHEPDSEFPLEAYFGQGDLPPA
jgi:hypothetical protein